MKNWNLKILRDAILPDENKTTLVFLLSYSLLISVKHIWITLRDFFLRWVISPSKKKTSHTDIHTLWLRRMHKQNVSAAKTDTGFLADESYHLALRRQSQQNNSPMFQSTSHFTFLVLNLWGSSSITNGVAPFLNGEGSEMRSPIEFSVKDVNTPSHTCTLT